MQKLKILFIACLFTTTLNAQSINKEQAAVQQTVEGMFATLSSHDTSALKKFVTSNVRFYEYGQVWNMDTLIQKVMQLKRIPDFERINNFQYKRTTIHTKAAWITYYLESIITRNGKKETLNWLETVVLVKQKGKWKIDVLHSTRIMEK